MLFSFCVVSFYLVHELTFLYDFLERLFDNKYKYMI